MATNKQKTEPQKYMCISCGRTVGEREFYSTDNPKYSSYGGKLPFCKKCITQSFTDSFKRTNNTKQSIISTAMRFDIPYIENNIPSFEDSEFLTNDESLSIWFEFIKLSNSVGKQLLSKKGFDYESWVSKAMALDDSKSLDEDEKLFLKESDYDIEIGKEEILFWGNGFSRKEYIFLTKSFLSLVKNFDVPNSIVANIYKDLCFLDLKIDEAKHNGTDYKELNTLMTSRRALQKDANISIYEKKGDDAIEGFGRMVKRLEMERPASDPLPEWENNKLKELSDIIAGHILMADGYDNKVVQDYKDVVEPYSIDPNNLWGDLDEEE